MGKATRFLSAGIIVALIRYAINSGFGFYFSDLYDPSTGLWRAAMTPSWIQHSILADFAIAFIIVAAYVVVNQSLGKRKEYVKKGLKFGLLAWLLTSVIGAILTFVYMPVSGGIIAVWLISGLLISLISGYAAAKIYG